MRCLALSIVILSVLVASIVGPTATASAAADVFMGTWTSIDTDGTTRPCPSLVREREVATLCFGR